MELVLIVAILLNLIVSSIHLSYTLFKSKVFSPPPMPPTIQKELEQFQQSISKPSAFTLALKDFEDPLDADEEEYFKTHNIPKRA